MVVEVQFVDGTSENFEIECKCCIPWEYQKDEQCFLIQSINGEVMIPAAFIKCMKKYKIN